MRIIGSLVVRNEEDRYLGRCLSHAFSFLDEVFVFDDRSDDDSAAVAESAGAVVALRDSVTPSFMEHEGRFREAAWRALESLLEPSGGDWVLSFDADEFMVSSNGDIRECLEAEILRAESRSAIGIRLHFPEVFHFDENDLFVRTDGFWGNIRGARLFQYHFGGKFSDKSMGSGSEPTYVVSGKHVDCGSLSVLHMGYATAVDRATKFERYSSLVFNGHADSHIQSIPAQPVLERWGGDIPVCLRDFMRENA